MKKFVLRPIINHLSKILSPKKKNYLKSNNGKCLAFTLAEILITLGIIGIVAALTIPNLMNSTSDNEFRAGWKKEYAMLSQIILQIYQEEGITYDDVVIDFQHMPTWFCRMQKHMNIIASNIDCTLDPDEMPTGTSVTTKGKRYWHADNKWYKKDGQSIDLSGNNHYVTKYTMVLEDGSYFFYNCTNQLLVDVNGAKPPNTVGRDIFAARMESKKPSLITPSQVSDNWPSCYAVPNCEYVTPATYEADCRTGSGWGCSSVYLFK